MSWREISPKDFNALKNAVAIDVRSPCEHQQERITGSLSIPLLSDSERCEIGTIYKHQGEMHARRQALKLIAPKLPELIDGILQTRRHGQALVIYCWRGGLRSEAVASILSIAGVDCFRLTGGYKAWRGQVLLDFKVDAYPFQPIVLHGLTGVGKTSLLAGLQKFGHQALDLEALANHKGSVFGGLGLSGQPTQKNFEGALWTKLKELDPMKPVFIEAESRKIGKLSLPNCVYSRIQTGPAVLVRSSVKDRARRITADYAQSWDNDKAQLARSLALLQQLKERLGNRRLKEVTELVQIGRLQDAVEIMLVDYYDPLYNRDLDQATFELTVSMDDVDTALVDIDNWLCARTGSFAGSQNARVTIAGGSSLH